jgi:AraC-like DNA-binding protein/quercetin dioxygenase-like cupin family protein
MGSLYRGGSMVVSARSDKVRADPDMELDLRGDAGVRSGTFEWQGPDSQTGWHSHPHHQLEYALVGVAKVETAAGSYLLPPQQAIWIPAGLDHCTTLQSAHSIALFLDPTLAPAVDDRARVIAVTPVVREMLVYGLRWPIERVTASDEARSNTYFSVLASVIVDGLAHEAPLHLPTTTDPLLARVLALTEATLATVTVADVCASAGMSERTLRRRALAGIGMTWQDYVVQSRLLRAAALLAEADTSVLDVANRVGYESQSAFARAFCRWMGDSPSAYRRRMRATEQR